MSGQPGACVAGCGRTIGTNGRYCSICWMRLDRLASLEYESIAHAIHLVDTVPPRRQDWLSLERLSAGAPLLAIQIETVAERQARERAEAQERQERQERERLRQIAAHERVQRERRAVYAGIAEKTKMSPPGLAQAVALAQIAKTLPPLTATPTVRPSALLKHVPYTPDTPQHRAVYMFAYRRYYQHGGAVYRNDGSPGWAPTNDADRTDPACCGSVLQKPGGKSDWQWHSRTAKHIANTFGQRLLTPRQLTDAYRVTVHAYQEAQGLAP